MQYLASLSQHDDDPAPGMLGSVEEAAVGLAPVEPHHYRWMVQTPQEPREDTGHECVPSIFVGKQKFSKALMGTCG